jgi:plasmid stabilization system protein ParE
MAGGKFVTDVKMLDNIRGKRVHEFPRFVIFYQIKANAVEIVRVLGWGQDVDALLVEAESG